MHRWRVGRQTYRRARPDDAEHGIRDKDLPLEAGRSRILKEAKPFHKDASDETSPTPVKNTATRAKPHQI
jgi:hypothetical protein